jgi:hypothetical protein
MNVLHKMVQKLGITATLFIMIVVLHFLVGHLLLGNNFIGNKGADQITYKGIIKNSAPKSIKG